MMLGLSKYGTGPVDDATDYLLNPINEAAQREYTKNHSLLLFALAIWAIQKIRIPQNAIGYLCASSRKTFSRNPRPVVISGDVDLVRRAIALSPHKHLYSSGVMSWEAGEIVSPTLELEIIKAFEEAMLPGMHRDIDFTALYVRHTHAGHHEINFLIPRIHLPSRRSLNIAPRPSSRKIFDAFRTTINYRYGFSDPDDPERTQLTRLPHHVQKLNAEATRQGGIQMGEVEENINQKIEQLFRDGKIANRIDVLAALKAEGFEIEELSKKAVIVSRQAEQPVRLEGKLYSNDFRASQLRLTPYSSMEKAQRLVKIQALLQEMIDKRRLENIERFGLTTGEKEKTNELRIGYAATGGVRPARPTGAGARGGKATGIDAVVGAVGEQIRRAIEIVGGIVSRLKITTRNGREADLQALPVRNDARARKSLL